MTVTAYIHRGWIGVDFDGTLATYGNWVNAEHTGEPITLMVDRVKAWLAEGREVRVFTARVWPILNWADGKSEWVGTPELRRLREATSAAIAIDEWCRKVFGHSLPITCVKDFGMHELWDDRAVQVRKNTGERV